MHIATFFIKFKISIYYQTPDILRQSQRRRQKPEAIVLIQELVARKPDSGTEDGGRIQRVGSERRSGSFAALKAIRDPSGDQEMLESEMCGLGLVKRCTPVPSGLITQIALPTTNAISPFIPGEDACAAADPTAVTATTATSTMLALTSVSVSAPG